MVKINEKEKKNQLKMKSKVLSLSSWYPGLFLSNKVAHSLLSQPSGFHTIILIFYFSRA
jgi:hypothetical protein